MIFFRIIQIILNILVLSAVSRAAFLHRPDNHRSGESLYKRDTFKVSAKWTEDGWSIPISIQDTTFNVWLDTGSSWLWVYSDQAPASEVGTHAQYRLPSDYTSLPVVEDGYGVGSLTARNLQDTVTIGGVPQTMDIDAATDVSWNTPFDGIIGLSFSNGDVAPSSYVNITKRQACSSNGDQVGCPTSSSGPNVRYTFMERLLQDYALTQPVFSLGLQYTTGGTVQFGDVDSTAYTGTLKTVPAEGSVPWWVVPGLTVTAGSASHTGDVLFDTGAPLTTLDQGIVSAYYAGISGSQENSPGVWTVPCGTSMPDLTFSTSAGSSTIPGSAFLTATNPVALDGSAVTVSTDMCTTRLGAVASGDASSIGTPFFATHYVIFNQQELTVSFALQA